MKLFYLLLLVLFNEIGCFDPTPPQPCQYTASFLSYGMEWMYHLDTTYNAERVYSLNGEFNLLYDCKGRREYEMFQGNCSWGSLSEHVCPVFAFQNYQFLGNVTYREKLCYQWNGTIRYSDPPMPITFYATVKDNFPVALLMPDEEMNFYYVNFTFGPPPASVFEPPKNCTNIGSQTRIFPNLILNRKNLNKA